MKTKVVCLTCQGEGKIMQATGDKKHPLRAITCPSCKGIPKKEERT